MNCQRLSQEELKQLIENATAAVTGEMEEREELEARTVQNREKEAYEEKRRFLRMIFEAYREAEPGGAIRKTAEKLMEVNRVLCPPGDNRYKVCHNVMVLRYMAAVPVPDPEICRRLGLDPRHRETLTHCVNEALEGMMISFFGLEGIKPRG